MAEVTIPVTVTVIYETSVFLDTDDYPDAEAMIAAADDQAATAWDNSDYAGVEDVEVDDDAVYMAYDEEE